MADQTWYQMTPPATPEPTRGKGLAVAALVLGIVSLVFSWVPIFNNVMAVTALVGLVLGIVALVGARKGRREGGGMALAGVLLSVLALILVIASQVLYTRVLNDVSDALSPRTTAQPGAEVTEPAVREPSTASEPAAGPTRFRVGETATISKNDVSDAATIKVSSVNVHTRALGEFGERPKNGTFKVVTITAINTGSDAFDVNEWDWYFRDSAGNKYEPGDGHAVSSGWQGNDYGSTTLRPGERRSAASCSTCRRARKSSSTRPTSSQARRWQPGRRHENAVDSLVPRLGFRVVRSRDFLFPLWVLTLASVVAALIAIGKTARPACSLDFGDEGTGAVRAPDVLALLFGVGLVLAPIAIVLSVIGGIIDTASDAIYGLRQSRADRRDLPALLAEPHGVAGPAAQKWQHVIDVRCIPARLAPGGTLPLRRDVRRHLRGPDQRAAHGPHRVRGSTVRPPRPCDS